MDYAVNHKEVCEAAKALTENENECDFKIAKSEDHLKNLLTPQYSWLFMHIGKLEKGVKFLVDLRTDILVRDGSNENAIKMLIFWGKNMIYENLYSRICYLNQQLKITTT